MNKNERLDHPPVEGGYKGQATHNMCSIAGCTNHRNQGEFFGSTCAPCFNFLQNELIAALDLGGILRSGPQSVESALVNAVLKRAFQLNMFPPGMTKQDVLERFYR